MTAQPVDNSVDNNVEQGKTLLLSPCPRFPTSALGIAVDDLRGSKTTLSSTFLHSSTIHSTYYSSQRNLSLKERGCL